MARSRRASSGALTELSEAQLIAPRNYQLEMLEASKKGNIIVVMDTGSGKTHIALMRIRHELDQANGKICWFLAPHVALAEQQFEVLRKNLPPTVNKQCLTGKTGVDTWTTQEKWDDILGFKEAVIVSTHQILLDALHHGFVKMERLGLLVFDEAHRCLGRHPANEIMHDFYHSRRRDGLPVPAILGLTASPIMGTDPKMLEYTPTCTIERNLNAETRTPTINRDELQRHVNRPEMKIVMYSRAKDPDVIFDERDMPGWSSRMSSIQNFVSGDTRDYTNIELGFSVQLRQAAAQAASAYSQRGSTASSEATQRANAAKRRKIAPPKRIPLPPEYPEDEYEEIGALSPPPGAEEEDEEMITPESESLYPTTWSSRDPETRIGSTVYDDEEDYEEIGSVAAHPVPPKSFKPAPQQWSFNPQSSVLQSLREVYAQMDMHQDPWVQYCEKNNSGSYKDELKLQSALEGNTYTRTQLKDMLNRATHLLTECGPWAADWFLTEVIKRVVKNGYAESVLGSDSMSVADQQEEEDEAVVWGIDLQGQEKAYLQQLLGKVQLPNELGPVEGRITEKVEKLIQTLLEEYRTHEAFSGIIFAEQRVAVVALEEILRRHSKTKDIFRPGSKLGSNTVQKKNKGQIRLELLGANRADTLARFRAGDLNILVATSVVEEGIDIQACCSIICFSPPQNLVAFVQRRGRGRKRSSTYIIMLAHDERDKVSEFEKAEKKMIEIYQDETRQLEEEEAEAELPEPGSDRKKVMPRTGALLTLKNAVPHLYHFCAKIPKQAFSNNDPEFLMDKDHRAFPGQPRWTASVRLPNALPPEIRNASCTQAWKSDQWAKRDAAFEAMLMLYEKELIDDHLMPILAEDIQEVEKRAPVVTVPVRKDPWEDIETKWENNDLFVSTVTVLFSEGKKVEVDLLLPLELPDIEPLQLFWTKEETAEVTFKPSRRIGKDPEIIERGRRSTYRLLRSMHANRMDHDNRNFAYLFVPNDADECQWDELPEEPIEALKVFKEGLEQEKGLVKDKSGTPYILRRFREDLDLLEAADFKGNAGRNPENVQPDQPLAEVAKVSKRRDFLHEEAGKRATENTMLLLPEFLFMDRLPQKYSDFSLLVPFITNRVEKALLAADLKKALKLPHLPNSLLVHAVTASSARDPVDYQRLEFLGDSVLKCLTSVALLDEHEYYHEGYLSAAKDLIVSNKAAADASAKFGLSKWITTQPFTALKWEPVTYPIKGQNMEKGEKVLSTKILADVVESVVGVSYLTGGHDTATDAINNLELTPQMPFTPIETRVASLNKKAATNTVQYTRGRTPHFTDVEPVLTYHFKNKGLLLEALTHPSYSADSETLSYQRLEFMGDSILDMIVTQRLYHSSPPLSHIEMHGLRSAAVNAHLLAFLCLGATVPHTATVAPSQRKTFHFPLHRFLRHSHQDIGAVAQATQRRYKQLRKSVSDQLDSAPVYPWSDLMALDAPKFMSDMIESLVGAIWIDSNGSFDAVEGFLVNIGLWKVLDRLVRDRVVCEHPRSRFGRRVANGGLMGEVRYETELKKGGEKGEAWWGRVSVNGETVGEARGVSRGHVGTVVAEVGLREIERLEKAGKWPLESMKEKKEEQGKGKKKENKADTRGKRDREKGSSEEEGGVSLQKEVERIRADEEDDDGGVEVFYDAFEEI